MRRASAFSVLTAICYSLIAPLALANSESNLPACCRRHGAHHCADGMGSSSTDQPAFQSILMTCPAFPPGTAASGGVCAVVKGSADTFALTVSHRSSRAQVQALYRISFNRSRQERGPPTLL